MALPARITTVLKVGAAAVGVYSLILGALLTPTLSRFALYANKFNTLFYHDLNWPLQFGFADGQVTPFSIETPDGQTLYAWHVLPLDVYARHEADLRTGERHKSPVADFTKTLPFKLLSSSTTSAPARVVINFHGNAGHIAQGLRTETYRSLAIHPNTHVVTIDYRGFGHSTGSPTEAGLIVDGTALINWVMNVAKIPSDRIVLLGQSLGTAVSAAVALNFADPTSSLIPRLEHPDTGVLARQVDKPTTFAGVILVAPFSNIPSLMLTYRLSGIVPFLAPIRPFPWLGRMLGAAIIDKWPTALRLQAYYKTLSADPKLLESSVRDQAAQQNSLRREKGAVQIIHAISDRDITVRQTEYICAQVVGPGKDCIKADIGPTLFELEEKGSPRFRFEIVQYGGHNPIITYSPVALAIVRALEGFPTR